MRKVCLSVAAYLRQAITRNILVLNIEGTRDTEVHEVDGLLFSAFALMGCSMLRTNGLFHMSAPSPTWPVWLLLHLQYSCIHVRIGHSFWVGKDYLGG
jgi:hypothetical protein